MSQDVKFSNVLGRGIKENLGMKKRYKTVGAKQNLKTAAKKVLNYWETFLDCLSVYINQFTDGAQTQLLE